MTKPKTVKKPVQASKKPPKLIYKPEVLDRVGVSYPMLWEWMRDGKFPLSRVVGGGSTGKIAWLASDIDAWILNRPKSKYRPRSETGLPR